MRTKLELIRTAKAGLLAQGAHSLRALAVCAYRGDGGRKCGVGFLIPDERYSPRLEGVLADSYVIAQAVGVEPNSDEHRLLKLIQNIHDLNPVEAWPSLLDEMEASCTT
jgi:hypothetical protein